VERFGVLPHPSVRSWLGVGCAYEAILFDFDGVLTDSEPVHFECWRDVVGQFGLRLDWDTYSRHGIGTSDRELLALLCRQRDPPFEIERLVAEYPRKKDLFRARMLEGNAFSEDVLRLLAELAGYRLAVVTSSGQSEVEPILMAAGIYSRFEAAVYGGDVKRLKPAPDPYLLAVERLGARSALVVEDSDAGEASARAAGLDVLRIQRQSQMPRMLRERLGLRLD
jgi:beta-phosphoglucomutase